MSTNDEAQISDSFNVSVTPSGWQEVRLDTNALSTAWFPSGLRRRAQRFEYQYTEVRPRPERDSEFGALTVVEGDSWYRRARIDPRDRNYDAVTAYRRARDVFPIDERATLYPLDIVERSYWGSEKLDRDAVLALLVDPAHIDVLRQCRCDLWIAATDMVRLVRRDGTETEKMCPRCLGDVGYKCRDCDRYFERDHPHTTRFYGGHICSTCLTDVDDIMWCDKCNVRHRRYQSDAHDHRDRSAKCCDEQMVNFSIAVDGAMSSTGRLDADARITLSQDDTIISDEGLRQIGDYLVEDPLVLHEWSKSAVSKDHSIYTMRQQAFQIDPNYKTDRGTFSRRLRSAIHKATKFNLPAPAVAAIGTIASANSRPFWFDIEITRRLNGTAREFAHGGSCWWTEYHESRCTLKSNGGFAIRSFKKDKVSGRMWVLPLAEPRPDQGGKHLRPTFGESDAYLVFNGYGEMTEYAMPRVMSMLTGWAFRHVDMDLDNEEMYVNSNSGYLVAPADKIDGYFTNGYMPESLYNHARDADLVVPGPNSRASLKTVPDNAADVLVEDTRPRRPGGYSPECECTDCRTYRDAVQRRGLAVERLREALRNTRGV